MKKIIILSLSLLIGYSSNTFAQNTKILKEVLELKIPREGGANGAGVAWHPIQKKYYAAMAGNVTFCMGVYDKNGQLLSPPEQKNMFDIRGIWYNPFQKKIQMNGYKDFGWAEYHLNKQGIPTAATTLFTGRKQPLDHSAGGYDSKNNLLYFFDARLEKIIAYDLKTGAPKDSIAIFLGAANQEEDDDIIMNMLLDADYDILQSYNLTTVVYTGLIDAEFGFINHQNNQIELYSKTDGFKTKVLKLPAHIKSQKTLNFSYSNETYWIFDKQNRIWKGFR